MPTCAIAHCHNGSGRKERPHIDGTKATCYRIPPTEGLQKQWEEMINRKNFVVNKNTTVCSLHFDFDAFVAETDNHDKYNRKRKNKTLKPRAFPTLDLRPIKPESETESSKRGQGRKTKIAKEVTVIPNKYLKLSNLAEHSFVPFVKDTSKMDVSSILAKLVPWNVQKHELNKPTKSVHEGQSKEDWIEANLADENYLALCETELKYEETESTVERVISIE